MRLIGVLAAVTMAGWFSSVTGSGKVKEETRPAQAFTKVDVSSGISLEVTQGSTPSVVVSADDNIVPLVVTEFDGSTLEVKFKSGTNIKNSHDVLVKATAAQLESGEASGGANLRILAGFKGASLEVDSSGGSRVEVKGLQYDTLKFDASGGGEISADGLQSANGKFEASGGGRVDLADLELKSASLAASGGGRIRAAGRAEAADIDASGGGSLNASGLQAVRAKADLSGGGTGEIAVTQAIEGDVSAGGSLTVIGSPAERNISTSAGGSVRYR